MSRTLERVPVPVRRVLDDVLDEDALQRAYAGVRTRRAERARAPRRRPFYLLAAALAVVALLVFVLRPRAAGPLALSTGAALVEVDAAAATELPLDDGSVITLDPGAKVVPLENAGDRVVLLLERGRARFEVKPGGPRRWLVECGVATVEVVGTGFTILRSSSSLRIEVAHGVVLVRGEPVPDRVKRLAAGESIEILHDAAPPPGAPVAPAPSPPPASIPMPSASATGSARPRAPAPWRELAVKGAFADAYDLLGASGIRERSSSASADELFLLADVARLSGHPGDAMAPLERIVREHAADSRAALAAFTLGKLYGFGSSAAAMYERAIQLGLPASLQGDARARWLEICKKLEDAACEERASGQ